MTGGPIDVNVAAREAVGGPTLRVYLLGRFAVQVDERWVADWRLRKAAAVVKLLALAPGCRLHREVLREALWPEQPAAQAEPRLRYTVHVARPTLHPDPAVGLRWLAQRDGSLVLWPHAAPWVDATVFAAAASAAQGTASLAQREAALALYAGDLLPDDCFADWAFAPREALRNQFLRLAFDLAREQVAQGELVGADATLTRLLADEPALAEAHLLRMVLYARQGRRYWALRQFQLLEAAVRQRLDAAPGPEARQLYRALREGHEIEALFHRLLAS